MLSVSKEMRFEAAHRLVRGYAGKCAHIHGHSWVVRVEVSGWVNDIGFVRDFSDFKPLRDWIDDSLDHSMIVSDEDKSMIEFLAANNQRTFIVNGNPTSENLCLLISKKAEDMGFEVKSVEIAETCTSLARVEFSDAED